MAARGQRKPKRPIGDLADANGMGRAVADHLGWRQTKGQSESTVTGGAAAARVLCGVVRGARHHEAGGGDAGDDERYQKWLYAYRQPKSDKPLTFTSQSKRAGIVLELFRWLSRAHRILVNPARTSSCRRWRSGCRTC